MKRIAGAHKKRIKRTTWPQQNNEFSARIYIVDLFYKNNYEKQ